MAECAAIAGNACPGVSPVMSLSVYTRSHILRCMLVAGRAFSSGAFVSSELCGGEPGEDCRDNVRLNAADFISTIWNHPCVVRQMDFPALDQICSQWRRGIFNFIPSVFNYYWAELYVELDIVWNSIHALAQRLTGYLVKGSLYKSLYKWTDLLRCCSNMSSEVCVQFWLFVKYNSIRLYCIAN